MSVITVVGLGPGDPGMLSASAVEWLGGCGEIWLRTEVHPVVEWIRNKGIKYNSFDYIYREAADFQEVYRRIADRVISMALGGDVTYAVPGHPGVAEESVELIIRDAADKGIKVRIIPGMSFLDALLAALNITISDGLHIVDGLRLDEQPPDPGAGTVVTQAYSRMVLSDIKLSLMEHYPDGHTVYVVTAAGVPGEQSIEECPLHELDRVKNVNHLTSVYLPPCPGAVKNCRCPLDPLVEVMDRLRGGGGCPWDLEQDHRTLRRYTLEEAYEVIDAINSQDMYNICEELGDLLLQVVFHARIASESGHFNINDVISTITEKLIRRHPHVFGGVQVESSSQVMVNWAAIKEEEKGGNGYTSLMDGIPGSLPALMKAQKMQKKAAGVGFDWPDYRGALDKVFEELGELKEAIASGDADHAENEMGDLLFAVVNLSRLLDIDAEVALSRTDNKFLQRFRYVEKMALKTGKKLSECTLDEMDCWWEEIKKEEKSIN